MEDLNNNCLTSHGKSQDSSDETLFKTGNWKVDSEKQCERQKRHKDKNENQKLSQQENKNISQNDVMKNKIEIQEDKMENSVVSRKNNDQSNRKSGDGDTLPRNSEDTHQKSRSDSRQEFKSNSDSGKFGSEKKSNKISKESSKEGKKSVQSSKKYLKLDDVKDDRSPGISRSSETQNKKRKKTGKEKHVTPESENMGHSKQKNKEDKIKSKDKKSDPSEPSMSFESYLNYDVNIFKRKERSGVKKPSKKIKIVVKEEEATTSPGMKLFKPPVMSINVTSPKQVYLTIILKV